jgi:hypothetical protein
MNTIVAGYRKIISFVIFALCLLAGLYLALKDENESAATIYLAFAPALGTGFGALIWGFRGGYQRDAAILPPVQPDPYRPPPPPGPPA